VNGVVRTSCAADRLAVCNSLPSQMFDTWIGTKSGIQRLHGGALEPVGLDGEHISAVHAWRDGATTTVLAGSYGNGLFRSTDDGASWAGVDAGLTAPALRCIGPDPAQPGALLAGTEPARIFRSTDGGVGWEELDGVTRIAGYERWFLPYSPRAGAVRNVYGPPGRPDRLLASVEVGGLLASDDAGASWTCSPIAGDEDIHLVTGHPQDPDLLYAALGTAWLTQRPSTGGRRGGVARSRDGGATWEKVESDYTRAVIVPPARPDLVLAAPALEVGAGGRIVVSADGGQTWEPAGAGIETPMPDMVERFAAAPDGGVWALCSGGRLFRATPGTWTWETALPSGADLQARSIAFVAQTA
jgi:photosystem II stability/assembly factor-like uncharacterized protein